MLRRPTQSTSASATTVAAQGRDVAALDPPASLVGVLKRPRSANPVASLPEASARSAAVIAWWEGLKRGCPLPSPRDLDRTAIAAAWPGSVLLTVGTAGEIVNATRLGAPDDPQGIVAYSTGLTDWLLALARQAARAAMPIEDVQSWPAAGSAVGHAILALPFAENGAGVDQILCRIRRA